MNTVNFSEDEATRDLAAAVNKPQQKPVVLTLPLEMLEDLHRTGGSRLKTITSELEARLQREHNEKSAVLRLQTETAAIIAAALGQADESPAHRLAEQMMEDFTNQIDKEAVPDGK